MGQRSLALTPSFDASDYDYGLRSSGQAHGVVLTQRHIVELMLDLAGYTTDRDLTSLRVLEPACGHGAFLVPVVERLLASLRRYGRSHAELKECITGLDIEAEHVAATRAAVTSALVAGGMPIAGAAALSRRWIQQGDALLAPVDGAFDVVIGNPPYVRIEQIAPRLQAEYRSRYATLFDRADLYVAFIERGLQLLSESGVLSFICADRWILNRYGGPLRALIARDWKVRCYIDLHRASPFESEVSAYPAIFCLSRGSSECVLAIRLETASPAECRAVASTWRNEDTEPVRGVSVDRYDSWFDGDSPWVLSSPKHLKVLRDLESRFAAIEADGTSRIGIGVASGCDRAFIVDKASTIEPDRLVPLAMRADIEAGAIRWKDQCIINVFQENGQLVALDRYPLLAAHLQRWEPQIRGRHVAKRNKPKWYRTIDRVYPSLVSQPKLLIPDIAGSAEVVFDEGHFHPHHNLYFITSDRWDLEVLGGLLASRVALFFIWSYAVKMRGGYLRFQAQYLRRIRVPEPESLRAGLAAALKQAFRQRDFAALDQLALGAYGLEELPRFDFVDTRK